MAEAAFDDITPAVLGGIEARRPAAAGAAPPAMVLLADSARVRPVA
jgi:hypothetical protein